MKWNRKEVITLSIKERKGTVSVEGALWAVVSTDHPHELIGVYDSLPHAKDDVRSFAEAGSDSLRIHRVLTFGEALSLDNLPSPNEEMWDRREHALDLADYESQVGA